MEETAMQRTLLFTAAAVALVAVTTTANARPVTVESVTKFCDGGGPIGAYHELGLPIGFVDGPGNSGVFAADEGIVYSNGTTGHTPCATAPGGDDGGLLNTLVSITNISGKSWFDLWFVSDDSPHLTNIDAYVGEPGAPKGEAFRSDNIGANTPLTSESMGANLIFEPGETWIFTIQDWAGFHGGITTFASLGIGGLSFPPAGPSNASIIALECTNCAPPPAPEPATLTLFGVGLLGLGIARRRLSRAAGVPA
ncbi:MAG: PEP-CTERM sorting domain-containing protein [Alphaproteobacteria bacterium]|nr:PEP-CTERM sorting domain-containing protein [Alphaproteobacteria bacterium]